MTISDTAGPNIGVKPSTNPGGAYVNQYYGGSSWGSVCWLDNAGTWTSYGSGYPAGGLTAVSNVTNVIPGGTEIVTVVNLGSSGVQMTQKFTHMTGDRFITKEWSIHNGSATTFSGARFYHGGDTLFGGVDSAFGFYDASKSMVYVRNNDYTNWGIMGFYANPGTPADRYFEGHYGTGNSYASARTNLPNTVDSSFLDAGYYLEWDRGGLAPGETWGISAYEIWTPAGALQIVAPGTQNAAPDSTVTLPFTVQNLGNTPLNLTLSAASSTGWTTTIVGSASVTIPANSSITQNVSVVVPVGATGSNTVTLTSAGDAVGSASTALNIANISLGISPASVDFGSLAPGATGQQLVTITNNSGAPITFGTVSAIAPFGRTSDNVSGQTLADGASLTVMATFSSSAAGPHSGSLNIPVVSPLLITRTVALSGTIVSNQPPVAVADSIVTDEDTGVSANAAGGVLGNDSDPDSDPLTASLVTGVSHGTLALGADGSYLYTPAANYHGADSFTYRAYDGSVYSNTVTVSITVNSVNDVPVAVASSITSDEDVPVGQAAPGVLGNVTDADGDPLTAELVTDVAHGSLTLNADGSFSYTPEANWFGTDSFSYRAFDGTSYSNTVTITFNVAAVNDVPITVADTATVTEDEAVSVPAESGVLANDPADIEGSPLTTSIWAGPAKGTLVMNADGSYVYTPDADFFGSDTFSYRAWDGTGWSLPATVTITVVGTPDAPVSAADNYTGTEDGTLNVAAPGVLGNDVDVDFDVLTALLVTDVEHGTLTLHPDGSFTYVPDANWYGTDTFEYNPYDGALHGITVTVTLTITPVNDPPVAGGDSASVNEDSVLTLDAPGVLGNDSDPVEGSALTADLVTDVSHGTLAFSADGSYTYTPAANYNGPDSFTYRAFDGEGYSDPATVELTVNGINDAPAAESDTATTAEDAPIDVFAPGVLGNDSDVEGGALTAVLVNDVSHGTLAFSADGSYTYTPAANYNGTDSFTYHATDGELDSEPVTVTISVTAVNDAPVAIAASVTTDEDQPLTVAAPGILGSATDVDGDTLTVDVVTDVAHGTLVLSADGSYTYTPAANFNGTDSFTYRVFDGTVYSEPVTLTFSVTSVNDAPAAAVDSATTLEDTILTVDAPGVLGNDTDEDGDSLTAALVTDVAHGTLTLAADGSYTYTPAANYNGTDSFTYRAFDGTDYSVAVTVSLTITAVYDAPVAVEDTFTAYEDATLNVAAPGLLGNDLGDGPLTVTAWRDSTHGTRGTVTAWADGRLRYVPEPNFHGLDYFVYRISDASNRSLYVTVTVNVVPVNDVPVATGDSAVTNEDTPVSIDVLGNDGDVDADTLTADVVGAPSHGAVTLGEGGLLVYTPAANYNGTDSFTYRAFDGSGYSNVVTVDVTISAIADAPIAHDDSVTTMEDTVLTVDVPGVLGNDADGDGDAMTAALVTDVAHGALVFAADGSYTYTPAANYNGTDSFTYRASDGVLDSEPATVTISVTAVNDAPVAVAASVTTDEHQPLTVAAPGVLGSATDVDGDTLTVDVVTDVAHGTLVIAANGSYTYTPAANYNGTDSFTYRAFDGTVYSEPVTLTFNVTSVNDAPAATVDSATTLEDTILTVDTPGVLGNDTDAEGDALTAALVTDVAHGTLAFSADGSYTYTPAANYNGTDSFTYRASDGALDSQPATVTISVTAVNDAPVAVAWSGSADEGGAMTVAAPGLLTGASDVDGDSMSATITVPPIHGTLVLSADGGFVYTPDAGFTGPDTFSFGVTDGMSLSAVLVAEITINDVNHAPVANADEYSVAYGTTLTVAAPGVVGNDTDADGDTLTATVVTSAAHGTVTLVGGGGLTYVPAIGFTGADTFTYRVSDGALLSAPADVTITVGRAPAEKTRLGGLNRYEVARNVAKVAFPDLSRVRNVIIVSGSNRAAADPITAGAVAGLYDAPLLLVNEALPTLPADTIATLKAIDAATTARINVRIVGGAASVPEALKPEIKKYLPDVTFERLGGADRYEVAANVALRIKTVLSGRGKSVDAVFIANGQTQEGMYSALALSPIAAHNGMPVLLVRSGSAPAVTLAALKSLGVSSAKRYAAGGTTLVSADVMRAAGVPTTNRIQGTDAQRASTAAAIAELAITKGWLNAENFGVANMLSDALTGGMLMGKLGGPLLYTNAGSLPIQTAAVLSGHRATIVSVSVFGGPSSVTESAMSDIADSLK